MTQSNSQPALDGQPQPHHVAFIMDGNGRWAAARNMPRLEGHRQGVETVRNIINESIRLGIKHLTFFAFSSENWKRPADEVKGLMGMIRHYFKAELGEMHEKGIRVKVFGDRTHGTRLEADILDILKKSEKQTEHNTVITVNFCINYGGRDDIVRAAQAFAYDVEEGRQFVGDLDEKLFSTYVDSKYQPDPDIIIRTGGERRISNFLLWQMAYAEVFFIDRHWPDFSVADFNAVLAAFARTDRRFGALKEEGLEAQASAKG